MIARIISALVAVFFIFIMEKWLGSYGLIVVSSLVVLVGMLEYSAMLLLKNELSLLKPVFFLFAGFIFAATVFSGMFAFVATAVASILFISLSLVLTRKSEYLQIAQNAQLAGILGFIYCAVFPGMGVRLLLYDHGQAWFLGLLAIVFAGDTFAYFFGRFFGRHKLQPVLSPKKTIEGAVGGLLGSALAGALLGHFFLNHMSLTVIIAVAVITGIFAQLGDLFESSLKRVANVKDSGWIMPGHGGILDRADGIYFSAPVYFALVWYIGLPQSPALSF